MIHRNIEKALDLHRVQVHRDHTMCSRLLDQISDQLRRNRVTGTGLPVLTRISVIRNNDVNALGRSPLQSIHHNEQLHQIIVHRCAGRLHDIDMTAAYALRQLHLDLSVAEACRIRVSHRNADIIGNLVRQFGIRVTGEYLLHTNAIGCHASLPQI
ncbi:hypothetical protein D3C77_401380 [compost metagenome]